MDTMLMAPSALAEPTDSQLLSIFIANPEDNAFIALLVRYAGRIEDACQRVLHHPQDEEDAAQNTWCVLLRKAALILKSESFPWWLQGAASHEARNLRKKQSRRQKHEKEYQTAQTAQTALPVDEMVRRELKEIIHREIEQLPRKYRDVLMRCDLQGKSRTQAALELGLPPGTVAKRRVKALALMRERLGRWGITSVD